MDPDNQGEIIKNPDVGGYFMFQHKTWNFLNPSCRYFLHSDIQYLSLYQNPKT